MKRRRKKRVVRVCMYCRRRKTFVTLKVPSRCPLVLLVKVRCREGRGLESDEGEVTGCGVFEFAAKENI
jgi:hypothetical protein